MWSQEIQMWQWGARPCMYAVTCADMCLVLVQDHPTRAAGRGRRAGSCSLWTADHHHAWIPGSGRCWGTIVRINAAVQWAVKIKQTPLISEYDKWKHRRVEDQNSRQDSETGTWQTFFALMSQTSSRPFVNVCLCVRQAQIKVDVSNLKEEIGKLKSQIVESPEELKSQMEKMRENVKNIKNSIVSRDFFFLKRQ